MLQGQITCVMDPSCCLSLLMSGSTYMANCSEWKARMNQLLTLMPYPSGHLSYGVSLPSLLYDQYTSVAHLWAKTGFDSLLPQAAGADVMITHGGSLLPHISGADVACCMHMFSEAAAHKVWVCTIPAGVPLLFMTNHGADPSQELQEVASAIMGAQAYHQLAMGQGQTQPALDLLQSCARSGILLA